MNFVKKIISCSLSLMFSVGLSGICAVAAPPTESSPAPLTKKEKQIIGGAAGGIGTGLLAGIVLWVVHSNAKKLNILVIGQDEQTRKSFIENIKNTKSDLASDFKTVLKSDGGYSISLDESTATISNWCIHECDLDDPKIEGLVEKSTVIIPILDSYDTINRLNDTFAHIPNPYGRKIISVINNQQIGNTSLHRILHPNSRGTSAQTFLDRDCIFRWEPNSDCYRFSWSDYRYPTCRELAARNYPSIKDAFKNWNEEWNDWIVHHPRQPV